MCQSNLFLKRISKKQLAATALIGAIAGGILVKRLWLEKYRAQGVRLELAEQERTLLRTWLQAEQTGAGCADYFTSRGYHRIAILGMNWEGRYLAELLGDRAVYGVELDHFSAVHERMTVYRLGEDPLPAADCLVICDLERLPEKLALAKREFSGEIITLCQILDEMAHEES